MRSISHHIIPLVINSLGHGHTHTHTHTHTHKHTHTNMHTDDLHRINFKKPGEHWPQGGMSGLNTDIKIILFPELEQY